MIIKSYFKYAELSVEEKKMDRFEQVISECNEFIDRFPESRLRKEAETFLHQSQTANSRIQTPCSQICLIQLWKLFHASA